MRTAFSLVELSIVLVILGLLTGGILGGQALIRSAEQRNFTTQVARYSTSVLTFRDKYFGIPGDFNLASNFWGAADGSTGMTAACLTATAAGTCNGDGNGSLAAITYSHEPYRFWQHLALAGLIEGNYTGVTGPLAASDVVAGVNVPATRLATNSVVVPYSLPNTTGSTWWFPGSYGSVAFLLGGDTGGSNFNGDSPIVLPELAWNMDTKMDDGRPGTGKVTTMLSSRRGNCASSDDAASATYVLNYSTASCVLLIPSGI
ncbi:MAG: hypothetical protein DI582_00080 [Azospirillum brasilense]|nr:MAG: hypothetical protein DI582_00080 [Azospirillum brasilense]